MHGGLCQDISVTLTAGIHDAYYTHISRYLSKQTPITDQYANQYLQASRQSEVPINKKVPNLDELFQIIKIAIEQNNIVGCNTSDVILSYLI